MARKAGRRVRNWLCGPSENFRGLVNHLRHRQNGGGNAKYGIEEFRPGTQGRSTVVPFPGTHVARLGAGKNIAPEIGMSGNQGGVTVRGHDLLHQECLPEIGMAPRARRPGAACRPFVCGMAQPPGFTVACGRALRPQGEVDGQISPMPQWRLRREGYL